jgi:hypothetical protein
VYSASLRQHKSFSEAQLEQHFETYHLSQQRKYQVSQTCMQTDTTRIFNKNLSNTHSIFFLCSLPYQDAFIRTPSGRQLNEDETMKMNKRGKLDHHAARGKVADYGDNELASGRNNHARSLLSSHAQLRSLLSIIACLAFATKHSLFTHLFVPSLYLTRNGGDDGGEVDACRFHAAIARGHHAGARAWTPTTTVKDTLSQQPAAVTGG